MSWNERPTASSTELMQANSSLLLQLVLLRWIATLPDLTKLKQPVSYLLDRYDELFSCLERLAPDSSASLSLPWNPLSGTLVNLRDACQRFSQHFPERHKEVEKLCDYAQQTLISCKLALKMLNSQHPTSRDTIIEQLETALKESLSAMKRFNKMMAKILPAFRDDENMLFFLVRHAPRFNGFYGRSFITKLLTQMHPEGLKEISRILVERYQRRGYHSLTQVINAKIEAL